MKMFAWAEAAGWKHNYAQGIRFFQNEEAVRNGGAEGKAVAVGDCFVQWPDILGPTPTVEQLDQWVLEYEASKDDPDKTLP